MVAMDGVEASLGAPLLRDAVGNGGDSPRVVFWPSSNKIVWEAFEYWLALPLTLTGMLLLQPEFR